LKVFQQPRSFQGETALLQAVGRGDVATVQVLVAAKANLEAKTSDVGLSFPY
jgi:ankyrin repeat protein